MLKTKHQTNRAEQNSGESARQASDKPAAAPEVPGAKHEEAWQAPNAATRNRETLLINYAKPKRTRLNSKASHRGVRSLDFPWGWPSE